MAITRKTDWSIRVATGADLALLPDFLGGLVWNDGQTAPATYQWKYQLNPQGDTTAFAVVNSSSTLVGCSMFMPWRLAVAGAQVRACQWTDLYVEPEYRGQAIADLTLRDGLEQSRRSGAPICFAFPNANSVPLHRKNNGNHIGGLVRYTRPLDVEYLIRRRISNPALAKTIAAVVNPGMRLMHRRRLSGAYSIERVSACGAAFDDLWSRYLAGHQDVIMSWKDAAYLNWKYVNAPGDHRRLYGIQKDSRLEGFIVMESSDVGNIVDLLGTSDEVVEELIAFALVTFRGEKRQSAAFTALEDNAYFELFKGMGFVQRPSPGNLFAYFDESCGTVPRQAAKWFITFGDSDLLHF